MNQNGPNVTKIISAISVISFILFLIPAIYDMPIFGIFLCNLWKIWVKILISVISFNDDMYSMPMLEKNDIRYIFRSLIIQTQ